MQNLQSKIYSYATFWVRLNLNEVSLVDFINMSNNSLTIFTKKKYYIVFLLCLPKHLVTTMYILLKCTRLPNHESRLFIENTKAMVF